MKKLICENAEFGPFQSIEETEGAYVCDGTVFPRTVVGDCQVADFEPAPAPDNSATEFQDLVRKYDGIVQMELDRVARDFGYGDPNRPSVSPILHAISYADEPAVPKFQAEGMLLRAWRSLYWAACWPILEAVRAGQRPVPEPDDLLAELNAASPPPTKADVDAKIAQLNA